MTLGEAILQRLKEQERSQAWLARKVGITRTHMTNIVKGKNFPRYDLLQSIMTELDIKMTFEL